MKRVFTSSDQVMHLWANQSQSDARCSNVFFQGKKIYSYGTHYELGRLETYKDTRIAFINDTGYSVTTSRGATVPFVEAKRLLERIIKGEALAGENIGSFNFNSVNAGIVRIGCHSISLEQAKLEFERYGA